MPQTTKRDAEETTLKKPSGNFDRRVLTPSGSKSLQKGEPKSCTREVNQEAESKGVKLSMLHRDRGRCPRTLWTHTPKMPKAGVGKKPIANTQTRLWRKF